MERRRLTVRTFTSRRQQQLDAAELAGMAKAYADAHPEDPQAQIDAVTSKERSDWFNQRCGPWPKP